MKSRLWILLVGVIVLASAGSSLADPIPGIVNTGNLSNGSPAGIGNADAWGGISVNPNAVGDAWMSAPAGSTWSSQHQTGGTVNDAFPFSGPPSGANYTYTLNFNLSGFDPASALINFQFAVDNALEVRLNGVTKQVLNIGVNASTFNSIHAGTPINSSFGPGANTLQFIVTNLTSSFNPEGLLVTITGTANPLQNVPPPALSPEPASIMLWGLAGVGACIGAWRRARRSRT